MEAPLGEEASRHHASSPMPAHPLAIACPAGSSEEPIACPAGSSEEAIACLGLRILA